MKEIKLRIVDWHEKDSEENFYNNIFVKLLSNRYRVLYSKEPDYVIFGPYGLEHIKYKDAVKIFFSGENLRADWNIADYGIDFDHIEFEDRHCRYPLAFWNYSYCDINAINTRAKFLDGKNKFCSFMVTAPTKYSPREKFFKQLCEYKIVDSGGRYLNNIGGSIGDRYGDFTKSKIEWLKSYKFNICFENSYSSGYLTEKIFQAFAAGCIPIYWGDPRIDDIVNSNSYINVDKFGSFEEVIEYIKFIDNNDSLFLKMINEPVFKEDIDYVKYFNDKFEEFLFYIFDQDFCKAKRAFIGERINERYSCISHSFANYWKTSKVRFFLRHPKKIFYSERC